MKEYFKEKKIRQSKVAEVLGISKVSVSSKVNGQQPWKLAELKKLSEHLNVPICEVVEVAIEHETA